jgi:hypothetical protein
MYGKIFSSMFEGSMFGAGATAFALMSYAISKQSPPDFNVEINSKLLSAILGESEEEVEKAIEYLCAPDPRSRSEKEDGRRLLRVGAFTYHVVNGEIYHGIRNYEERKAYNREKQAEYRAKKNLPQPTSSTNSTPAPRKQFIRPTLDQIISSGMPKPDAVDFFNYYQSCGWTVGKNKPMKDWESAAAGWMNRKKKFNGDSETPTSQLSDAELVRQAQL